MITVPSSNVLLWLGLGISLYALYSLESMQSRAIKNKTSQSPKTPHVRTIDDVESFHLYNLTRHPNGKIASTQVLFWDSKDTDSVLTCTRAIRILCRRALNDPVTRRLIHQDAHSPSMLISARAEKTIELIRSFDDAAFSRHDENNLGGCLLLNEEDHPSESAEGRHAIDHQPENIVEFWNQHSENGSAGNDDQIDQTQNATPRPRNRTNSPGERARRRRRREAIVLNEGDRPVTQQDIIQRRQTG